MSSARAKHTRHHHNKFAADGPSSSSAIFCKNWTTSSALYLPTIIHKPFTGLKKLLQKNKKKKKTIKSWADVVTDPTTYSSGNSSSSCCHTLSHVARPVLRMVVSDTILRTLAHAASKKQKVGTMQQTNMQPDCNPISSFFVQSSIDRAHTAVMISSSILLSIGSRSTSSMSANVNSGRPGSRRVWRR